MGRVGLLFFGTIVFVGLVYGAAWLRDETRFGDRLAFGKDRLAELSWPGGSTLKEDDRRGALLALELFTRAVAERPDNAEARRGRAMAALVLGRAAPALADMSVVASGEGRRPEDLALVGALRMRLGAEVQALGALEEAKALDPDGSSADLLLAWLRIAARTPDIRDPARGWRELLALDYLLAAHGEQRARPAVRIWMTAFDNPAVFREELDRRSREALDAGWIDPTGYDVLRMLVGSAR